MAASATSLLRSISTKIYGSKETLRINQFFGSWQLYENDLCVNALFSENG